MVLQIKDPSVTVIAHEPGLKALAEQGSGGSASIKKIVLGSAAAADVGTTEGTVPLLTTGGALPAALLSGREPLHALEAWATATRTLALADDRKHLHATHATPVLTIPDQATVAFGANYVVTGTASSGITLTGAAGVTINGTVAGSVTIPAETAGGGFILWRRDADTWVAMVMDGTTASGAASLWPITAVSGSSYTITGADAQKVLLYTSNSAYEFTLASDLGADFQCLLHNTGTGEPTIVTSGGQSITATDGTAPLRMRKGAASAAVMRIGANSYSVTGLQRTGSTFTPAVAADHWEATTGLVLPTTESLDAAEAEQTGSCITLSSGDLSMNAALFWNGSITVSVSSVSFATLTNMNNHARRVRIVNTSGGACSVTAGVGFDTANFGAGVSIPDDKSAAFIIENLTTPLVTFAGYGD